VENKKGHICFLMILFWLSVVLFAQGDTVEILLQNSPLYQSKNRTLTQPEIIDTATYSISSAPQPVFPQRVCQGRKLIVPNEFLTIQSALDKADSYDTVFICSGIYYENVVINEKVALIGQDMLKTVIDGRCRAPCVIAADSSVICNLTIRNGKTGILCKAARPLIDHNLIIGNKGVGIHALIALPVIRNNVIMENRLSGILLESARSAKTQISHNIIIKNKYSGIYCAHRTEVHIQNNIIMKNGYGIFIDEYAIRTHISYNDFFNNRHPTSKYAAVDTTNIFLDPLFIEPSDSKLNFYIQPHSPCKAKGEDKTDIGLFSSSGGLD
jgi:OmpA-OmpF porin, OOP family